LGPAVRLVGSAVSFRSRPRATTRPRPRARPRPTPTNDRAWLRPSVCRIARPWHTFGCS